MTQYREILRLHSINLSQSNIAASCGASKKTVNKVLKAAKAKGVSWPLDDSMTDAAMEEKLFPKVPKVSPTKQMPDFDYIRKELLRNGVNKKLLWTEYLESCRQNGGEPLMYSRFCYYIQQDEQRRRATMHISRRPGEQIEVDWAGDPAYIVDPDTGEATKAHMYYSVPHEYIKRKVDVRVTASTIEVFYKQARIASHRRPFGRKGQYSTVGHLMQLAEKFMRLETPVSNGVRVGRFQPIG